MRSRWRTDCLFGLAAAILAAGVIGAKPQPLPRMTPEQWRADIDFVARELPRRHKNAFHSMTGNEFQAAIAALRARAGESNDDQMIVGLMRITAMVGDGHTYVRLPSSSRLFPITIVEVENVYRVVRGAGAAADLVGGRLISIDETPIDEAASRIRTILPQHESEVLLRAFTPLWLSFAGVLRGLGVTANAETARFTVVLDDGTERSAEVTAIDRATTPQGRTLTSNPPLARQRPAEGFWFTWLPEAATVYVNFRRYDDLRAKSRELWSYSTRYYEFLPHDGLVTPDQEIKPTWADWLAGRDPVLDWIIKQ